VAAFDALNGLAKKEQMNFIRRSFPKQVLVDARSNKELHVLLHALLQLKGISCTVLLTATSVEKTRALVSSATKMKKNEQPLKNWFSGSEDVACSSLITILAILANGPTFVEELLNVGTSQWPCKVTEPVFVSAAIKRDKTLLMNRPNSGNKNWRNQFKFKNAAGKSNDANGVPVSFEEGFPVLLVKYIVLRYTEHAGFIEQSVAVARNALADPDVNLTRTISQIQSHTLPEPAVSEPDNAVSNKNSSTEDESEFASLMAILSIIKTNPDDIFPNDKIPDYLAVFGALDTADPDELKAAVEAVKVDLIDKGKKYSQFFFGAIEGPCSHVSPAYNVAISSSAKKGLNQSNLLPSTKQVSEQSERALSKARAMNPAKWRFRRLHPLLN